MTLSKKKRLALWLLPLLLTACATLKSPSPLVVAPAVIPPPLPELMELESKVNYLDNALVLFKTWLEKLNESKKNSSGFKAM